jgi:ribosomal protein S18 acetylase RimI-like enzyme
VDVRSLGYRTDLIFSHFDGQVEDFGDYVVVRAASNPGYFWGNFILFKNPPQVDSHSHWENIFQQEIESKLDVHHKTFGWDSIDGPGEVQPFLDAGYTFLKSVVLSTTRVNAPPKQNDEVEVRVLKSEDDWQQALELQIACKEERFSVKGYTEFRVRQIKRYRAMEVAGLGHWFGAFLDEQLVADLGIFKSGDMARFQHVETHPEFRRLGICGTLVYQASTYAFENMNVKTLVMVADEEYHATKIYESVGFRPTERQFGLEWFNPDHA